LSYVEFLIM